MLLLHLLAGLLLLRQPQPPSLPPPAVAILLLRQEPPPAQQRPQRPVDRRSAPSAALRLSAPPTAIQLPAEPAVEPVAAPAAAAASAPAALDLRLPAQTGRAPPPGIAELARADPRANSPRASAEERMANALGAQGWRSIDLGDGAKKLMGPFGECYISRPSMVEQVPGHPLQGMVPNKVFGCGGIEKGSLKHERPK